METLINDDRRADALDREAFEEMIQSAVFARLWQRIQNALNGVLNQCERSDDDLVVRRAQGQAAALRMVLGLPQQMLNEMKERKRNAV